MNPLILRRALGDGVVNCGTRFTQVLFNSGGGFTWQGRRNRHIVTQVSGNGLLRFLAPVLATLGHLGSCFWRRFGGWKGPGAGVGRRGRRRGWRIVPQVAGRRAFQV